MEQIVVLDTETGGLDPGAHSLLSIGVVVWQPPEIVGEIEIFVAEPQITCDDEALAVNRANISWLRQHGLDPVSAIVAFEKFILAHFPNASDQNRITIAGHNIGFDVSFLKRLYRLAGRQYEIFSHRLIDTAGIIQFLSLARRLPLINAGSDKAFEYFKMRFREANDTLLTDAKATAQLLNALWQL